MESTIKISLDLAELHNGFMRQYRKNEPSTWGHLHGPLEICIGGRYIPPDSFHDSGDVCLDEWLSKLSNLIRESRAGKLTSLEAIWMGEDGARRYIFQRMERTVYFSIQYPGIMMWNKWRNDPSWQGIPFKLDDLERELKALRLRLLLLIAKESPENLNYWKQVLL